MAGRGRGRRAAPGARLPRRRFLPRHLEHRDPAAALGRGGRARRAAPRGAWASRCDTPRRHGRTDAVVVAVGRLVARAGVICRRGRADAPVLRMRGERRVLFFRWRAAVLLVFSSRNIRAAAVGTCGSATVVCAYSLIDRLIAGNAPPYGRLGGPGGYWNVLGVRAAAGACLAVALISHERRPAARAAAGCAVPILVGALYLTFSRGSWLAGVIGLAVMAATDARRREFAGAIAAVALPAGAVAACGALAHALTTPTAPEAAVTPDAHRYAVPVLLASAASA